MPTINAREFAERVKTRRLAVDMSQKALSDEIAEANQAAAENGDVPTLGDISKFENSHYTELTDRLLKKAEVLATHLGTEIPFQNGAVEPFNKEGMELVRVVAIEVPTGVDPETGTLAAIVSALTHLNDAEAQKRILEYLNARFMQNA